MKYKMIYQHDERDCGAASLAMILHYYGLKIPLAKCREITGTNREGTNIYGIVKGAEKVGLIAEGLSGSLNELLSGIHAKEIKLPFIAHIVKENGQGHFVVVSKLTDKYIHIIDPAKGKYRLSLDEFLECWLGNIVSVSKTERFKEANLTQGSFLKFLCLLKGQCIKWVSAFILSVVLAFLGILSAYIFQTIVDEFGVTTGYYEGYAEECTDENCQEEHNHEENIFVRFVEYVDSEADNYQVLFGGAICLYIMQGLIQFARTWLIAKTVQKIDMSVTMDYYSRLVRLPMETISTRKTGEYLSRFADTAIIRDVISQAAITIVLDVLLTIACGVLLYEQSKEMFVVAVCVMALHVIVVITYRKPLENINRKLMESSAEVEAYVKETIDGIETIKVCCKEEKVIDKNKRKYFKVTHTALQETLVSETQNVLSEMIELIGSVIIMWVGFELVLNQIVTIGALLSFFIMLGYFTAPINNLIQLQPLIQTAMIAADRLNDVLEMSAEESGSSDSISIGWKKIRYDNVSFQYRNQKCILRDINFCIEKGQKIAIVGESGSGKTSLAKLLVGLYTADAGSIFWDERKIAEISLEELRKHIAYVKQDTYLFTDTIKNNLLMDEQDISEEELDEVCNCCMLNEILEELPYGYDTGLSEMGQNISAGQRQRLTIARALLRKPDVLILDEAMSNLDMATESRIRNNLFNMKNLTLVMISHRLSTVAQCDKIIVMEKGTIAEIGTHEELLAKKGIYYNLLERQ